MLNFIRERGQQAPRIWGRIQQRERDRLQGKTHDAGGPASQRSVPWQFGFLALLITLFLSACASQQATQPPGPAFNYAALTETLQRGISTPLDVKKALGEPKGSGGFLYPTDAKNQTLWFYEKMKIDTSGGKTDVRQDVLLVFFKAGRFDGFLWFSDARNDW